MKGIVLAGGTGSRLWPITKGISKGLLPVFDKPVVYYPITTLMLAGIRDILIISTPDHINLYQSLLGDGHEWGVQFQYVVQTEPKGIPEAITLGQKFTGDSNFALILGDNLLHGSGLGRNLSNQIENNSCTIFAYEVSNPEEYGVIEFNKSNKPVSIIEKPKDSVSNWAIPGLYFFDKKAFEFAKKIKLSKRGEFEIVDVLNEYLKIGQLNAVSLPRGTAWLDLGNSVSLSEASDYVRAMQTRQGLLIGSPEEIAWRMGWIKSPVTKTADKSNSLYSRSLRSLETNNLE